MTLVKAENEDITKPCSANGPVGLADQSLVRSIWVFWREAAKNTRRRNENLLCGFYGDWDQALGAVGCGLANKHTHRHRHTHKNTHTRESGNLGLSWGRLATLQSITTRTIRPGHSVWIRAFQSVLECVCVCVCLWVCVCACVYECVCVLVDLCKCLAFRVELLTQSGLSTLLQPLSKNSSLCIGFVFT